MKEGLTILAEPDSGFHWVLHEINTQVGEKVIAVQEPLPPPPTIIEQIIDGEGYYGEGGLGMLMAILMFWQRIRSLLEGLPFIGKKDQTA